MKAIPPETLPSGGRCEPILGGGVPTVGCAPNAGFPAGQSLGERGGLASDPRALGLEGWSHLEGAMMGAGQALTWLWDVLVTPHTVVTTEREPGGWLVFCCQGTGS